MLKKTVKKSKKIKQIKAQQRQFFGMQSIDQRLSHLLKPIFDGSKKEFLLINNLVKNWQDVVGKKYVKFCYPKSVRLEKTGSGSVLTIAAHNSAIGFFLENSNEIILERIATIFGFKAINRIVIKQEPKDVSFGPTEIKLLSHEEEFIQQKISLIENQELAQTLKNLGREILAEKF